MANNASDDAPKKRRQHLVPAYPLSNTVAGWEPCIDPCSNWNWPHRDAPPDAQPTREERIRRSLKALNQEPPIKLTKEELASVMADAQPEAGEGIVPSLADWYEHRGGLVEDGRSNTRHRKHCFDAGYKLGYEHAVATIRRKP